MKRLIPLVILLSLNLSCFDTKTYFLDTFDTKGDWVLTETGNDPPNQDTASSAISNGELALNSSQNLGCPKATAELDLTKVVKDLNGILIFDIHINVIDPTITAMGENTIESNLKGVQTKFKVNDYVDGSKFIVVHWSGQDVSLRVGTTTYFLNSALIFDSPHIKFESTACGADGLGKASMKISSVSVTNMF